MQVKPVRMKVVPQYPTQDYLETHPELLAIVPERWQQNALVRQVLGGVVCLVMASQSPAVAQQPATAAASRIAPLFVHGEGFGMFGCMAVNPPVFLSEDEARKVIQEEAKKAGLEFAPDALTIPDVYVPVTEHNGCSPIAQRLTRERQALALDGFDRKHGIAFEFVSQQDFIAWESKSPGCVSSVSSFDMKGTAESLRSGLKSAAKVPWLGVFYEPGAARGASEASNGATQQGWEQRRKAGREVGKEELRKQVRDFIQWLKAQGVI